MFCARSGIIDNWLNTRSYIICCPRCSEDLQMHMFSRKCRVFFNGGTLKVFQRLKLLLYNARWSLAVFFIKQVIRNKNTQNNADLYTKRNTVSWHCWPSSSQAARPHKEHCLKKIDIESVLLSFKATTGRSTWWSAENRVSFSTVNCLSNITDNPETLKSWYYYDAFTVHSLELCWAVLARMLCFRLTCQGSQFVLSNRILMKVFWRFVWSPTAVDSLTER